MKKAILILVSGISLALLTACSRGNNGDTQETSSNVAVTSTSSSKKTSAKEKYDELSQDVKMVLIANTVDSRIKDYPNLEGLDLYYFLDNEDVYLQITSGAGVGHPIYKLSISDDGVTPMQGVSYMGISGYEEAEVTNKLVTKKELFNAYTEDQSNFDNSSKKAQEDTHLKDSFNEQMSFISTTTQQENSSDNNTTTQPSDDEILNYFVNFILDDLGTTDSFIKQQAKYSVDENGEQMIRYGGGQGAYTTIEGNRIIYSLYNFGGVSADGIVEKTKSPDAYYDFATGEHGIL